MSNHSLKRLTRRGFTLIELLLVIGIIAILASIVIVAINPTKQLGDARNAQRRSDVNTILNAVYQFSIDKNGLLPGNLSGSTVPLAQNTFYKICMDGNATAGRCPTYTSFAIVAHHLTGSYLLKIPQDPTVASTGSGYSGYEIQKDANGRITVKATRKDGTGPDISVSR